MSSYLRSLDGDTREGNGTPLQYSCLENPIGGGAWWAAVHGVVRSRTWLSGFTFTRLSGFTFTFHFHALEKEMATYSSVLAWRIPGTAVPGGLPSMGSQSQTRLKWLSSSSSKHLLISWLQSPSAVISEPPKIKFAAVSTVLPSICMKWWGQMQWS